MFPLSEGNHASVVTDIISLFVRELKSKPRDPPLASAMQQHQEREDLPASCQPSTLCSGNWNSEALSSLAASPRVFIPLCPALPCQCPACLSFSATLPCFPSPPSSLHTELGAFPLPLTLPLTGRPVQIPLPSLASFSGLFLAFPSV